MRKDDVTYLVTNRHVVRGRHQADDVPLHTSGAYPDSLHVYYHTATQLVIWNEVKVELYDSAGDPLWLEHPRFEGAVDVALLALPQLDPGNAISYDPWETSKVLAMPSERLSIVGFPFGIVNAGILAIWVQGFIATEPMLDHDGLPCFLVDSRTRAGQSGSPVIFFGADYRTPEGGRVIAGTQLVQLMGIYSGRINSESDLGIVWKPSVIQEILQ